MKTKKEKFKERTLAEVSSELRIKESKILNFDDVIRYLEAHKHKIVMGQVAIDRAYWKIDNWINSNRWISNEELMDGVLEILKKVVEDKPYKVFE